MRNYSTAVKNNINEDESSNSEDLFTELNYEADLDYNENSLIKEQAIKDFKKNYRSGYLGYTNIQSFGNVASYNIDDESFFIDINTKDLEPKFEAYLKEIPENLTYSILPVLRWQHTDGNYNSVTISNSIKITRFTSFKLLAKRISYSLQDALSDYNLSDLDIELFIMGRPWLSADDFNIELPKVTEILNEQIKNEIKFGSNLYPEKASKLKNYEYNNNYYSSRYK